MKTNGAVMLNSLKNAPVLNRPIIGEVPDRLRHVYNLIQEIAVEISSKRRKGLETHGLYRCWVDLEEIFYQSLATAIPKSIDFDDIKVCCDWKVVGIRRKV